MPILHKIRGPASSLLFAVFAFSAAAAAQATVIGFEGVVADTGIDATLTPYTESGYVFSSNKAAEAESAGIVGKDWEHKSLDTGSAMFAFCSYDARCSGQGVIVTLTGPAPFSLTSIGVGKLYDYQPGAGKLELIGHLAGGGTVTRTLNAEETYNVFTLTGFDRLLSLNLIGREVDVIGIDNLVVHPTQQVPEPGILSLSLAAAMGLWASRRKRRSSQERSM